MDRKAPMIMPSKVTAQLTEDQQHATLTSQVNNQSLTPSTAAIQFTLTLKMTLITVNSNSPIQDNIHPDDHTQAAYENCYYQSSRFFQDLSLNVKEAFHHIITTYLEKYSLHFQIFSLKRVLVFYLVHPVFSIT